ncbi:MAG: cystathionine gamma-synthase family protein [Alphaproteobacteria bacterium]|nr:cystathionine gamma-synthase family protein [Alphaproteobacteria bacterium]MCD8526252.1 cystathionine gamma-synthase family protein [Alphaproteobacteria bacterium]MCD8570203.1 cystathionine gamma-synthase family protein [Alphaproteobacteria bacterium]
MTDIPKNYKKRSINNHTLKPETLMMSYGYAPQFSEGSVKPPVFLTSTFVFNSAEEGEELFHVAAGRKPGPEGSIGGLVYSRFNHPNVEIIEDRLAVFEGSESCVATSSGMGAISSVLLAYLRPDDVVLHSTPLYGGTETLIRKLMPEFGVKTVSFNDGMHENAMLESMNDAAKAGPLKMIFIETPANPTNALVDFRALTQALDNFEKVHGYRPVTACDNTMLGPIFQQVIPNGVDLAIYSVTKYIGGHSDLVAGAVCGSKEKLKPVRGIRNSMGLNLDPHTSWMISRSLETLVIRVQRAADTGRKVAEWIAANPYKPAKVYHPDLIKDAEYQEIYKRQCSGPGSTFSFVVDAPKAQVFKLINALQLFKSAVSLGGSESLVCHPATTTHSGVDEDVRASVGVTEGLVRLSIGLEHPDDLIVDLENAFKTAFN